MRKTIIAMVLAALLLPACTALAQAQARLKFGTIAPRGSLYHQGLLEMGETWKRAEGAGATFTVFADGSQGGEADLVRRMRIGQLHGALMSVVGLSAIDPGPAALQKMPLMFRSWAEVDAAAEGVHPVLEKRMRDKGFVVLLWAEGGWVRFFSRERAIRPADFKRLKIFAWAGDPEQVALMKAIGYQPVVLETGDILPGLQTGLVNAVPAAAVWALSVQMDTSAGHMLDIRWAPIVGAAVITRNAWDTLTPAGREAMQRGAAKAAADMRARRASADLEAIEAMRKRGLQVHAITPELEAEWRELAESVYPRIRGTMVPADLFDAVQGALAQYRGRERRR